MYWRTVPAITHRLRLIMRDTGTITAQRWGDEEFALAIMDTMQTWANGAYVLRTVDVTDADREAGQLQLPWWASHLIGAEVQHQNAWQAAHNIATMPAPGGFTVGITSYATGDSNPMRLLVGWYNPTTFPMYPFQAYSPAEGELWLEMDAGETEDLPPTGYLATDGGLVFYSGWAYDDGLAQYKLTGVEYQLPVTGLVETQSMPAEWVIATDDDALWSHLEHSMQAFLHNLPLSNAVPETRDQHERQAMYHGDLATNLWARRNQRGQLRSRLGPKVV